MARTPASRRPKRGHEGLPSGQNACLRGRIEKDTEGVTLASTRYSPPQFPLRPYRQHQPASGQRLPALRLRPLRRHLRHPICRSDYFCELHRRRLCRDRISYGSPGRRSDFAGDHDQLQESPNAGEQRPDDSLMVRKWNDPGHEQFLEFDPFHHRHERLLPMTMPGVRHES